MAQPTVAIQSDGKIVAAGGADISGGAFALARYNVDGTLDPTFGAGGKVVTDFTPPSEIGFGFDSGFGVAIQSDGKIVVAGVADVYGDDSQFALARYDPDGTLDGSFGDGGRVRTHLVYAEGAADVAIQADGKIVVAGNAVQEGFIVLRYASNGTPDTSFGNGGAVFIDFPVGFPPAAYALAIQSDGRIVPAGTTDIVDIGARFLARLLAT